MGQRDGRTYRQIAASLNPQLQVKGIIITRHALSVRPAYGTNVRGN